MRKIINKSIVYFTILMAVLLALSYLAIYISPVKVWYFSFLGLAYPYLLSLNIILIIYLIFRKNRIFLVPLAAILLGYNIMTSFIQVNVDFLKRDQIRNDYSKPRRIEEKTIKVLTYNVRAFNLYNWVNNEEAKDSIFRFIINEDPDIICFQEYFTQEKGPFTTQHIYKLLKNTPYRHVHYTLGGSGNSRYGIATFSAYPLVGKGIIRFENTSNISIFTDIEVFGDTIRVFNNHLQSIHLNRRNYAFIDSMRLSFSDQQMREILDISIRLRDAFIWRAEQADVISGYIVKSPYPVIVCGDFNDTPVSYTYRKMRTGLIDTFMEAGSGIENTYSGSFPSFRIDYVLHSPEFKAIYHERYRLKLSDHFPTISYLKYDF